MSKPKQASKWSYSQTPQESAQVSNFSQNNLSSSQKAKSILQSVEQKMIQNLKQQSITISLTKIPFLNGEEKINSKVEEAQMVQLQKMRKEKQETQNKLLQMEESEKILMREVNLRMMKERCTSEMRVRSQFCKQDMFKLRKIKQKQTKFQQKLKQKTKAISQKQLKLFQQQNEFFQKQKQQQNENKKIQIKRRLQQLASHQKQRQIKFLQSQQRSLQFNSKARLYSILQTNWQEKQMQSQLVQQMKNEERKKQNSIDLKSLKQHSIKYEQTMRKNRQQVCRKRMETNKMNQKLFKIKVHQTRFHTILLQEQKREKQAEHQKKLFANSLIEKKKQFSQSVKINHPPRSRTKSEENQKSESITQNLRRIPLQYNLQREVGLKYLEQSKNKIDKMRPKQNSFNISQLSEISSKKQKYHDYLSETRMTRQKSEGKSLRIERNYNLQVEEARKIMKETVFSEKEKIQRAKMVAERIKLGPQTSKSSSLLKKIQAKMQILQTLQ